MIGVLEMERKVVKMGNSVGVNIPAEILKQLSVQIGDKLDITVENGAIVMKKKPQQIDLPEGISPDFFEGLEKAFKDYDQTLRNLVDR